ncbi:hypothetical protein BGZ50_006997 [Haplosporangium sp. Z 11]|nr:hypothetical protein BGZ50_006997 [Haplosporangium sp. Z 11]
MSLSHPFHMHSMDQFQYKRLRPSIRRSFRRIRKSFRLRPRRNVLTLLIGTILILLLISRIGHRRNSAKQRWARLQSFARPGILGAPSDLKLNDPEAVHVQLCNIDDRLCSKWGRERLWDAEELRRDESWLVPGWIKVPIGVEVKLTMSDGRKQILRFLATNSDIVELRRYFEQPSKLALYDSIALTIVKPNYSLGTHTRYPINQLRNIGIQTASTDYIFMIDADFVPTPQLYSFASSAVIPLLEKAKSPTAYVVPCVAIKIEYNGRYPDTIKELQPLMKSGMAYITDPRAGHGPTATRVFMNRPIFGSSPAYEVCFESQWEPYYIVNRHEPHPYYDERFKNQGGDKQSHALLMNAIGYRFLVLRDHFMYHMDHPELQWTGDGLDKDKQKDYTYFADYVPELERILGNNLRWPRGCSRPLVHSSKLDHQGMGTM